MRSMIESPEKENVMSPRLLAPAVLLTSLLLTACSQDADNNDPSTSNNNTALADMSPAPADMRAEEDMKAPAPAPDMKAPIEEDMRAPDPCADGACDMGCEGDACDPPVEYSDEQWAAGTWKFSPAGPGGQGNQDDMWCFDADACVVANASGAIWKTDDGGDTWAKTVEQPGTFFRAIAFFDDAVGIAANIGTGLSPSITDTNVFYRTTDSGVTWAPVDTQTDAPGMCNLHPVSSDVMWASGRVTGPSWVAKTADAGVTWEWIDMSEHFDMVIDLEMMSEDEGLVIGSKDNKGRVVRTTDAGQTWEIAWDGEREDELPWKISFPEEDLGYIGVQNNGATGSTRVLKTTDGGETWTATDALPMPYRVKGVGFATANVGWLAGEDQAYQTTDGGQTWEEVPGLINGVNRFRFPEPGVAWAVGTVVWKLDIRE